MRKLNAIAGLMLLVNVFCGCSITIGTGGEDGRWSPSRREDAATISEIDTAAGLTFDNGKEKAFIGIASRPSLSARAQVHLVEKSMRSLTFDNAKQNVLLALVNNPHFLAEGKKAVLDNLDALTFDSGKQEVLEAINRRGHVPAEDEIEIIIDPQQQQEEGVHVETSLDVQAGYATEL